MKETKLYAKLRPHLEKWGACDRVENELGSGMPDIFYGIDEVGGWIETKVAKGQYIYFEKFQLPWMRNHLKSGFSRIWIIVLHDDDIKAWPAKKIVFQPVEAYEKWTIMDVRELPAPFWSSYTHSWDSLRATLIS